MAQQKHSLFAAIKRDGRHVPFCDANIARALGKAFGSDVPLPTALLPNVMNKLTDLGVDAIPISVIQDTVEKALMDNGHFDVAKRYIIYRHAKDQGRNTKTTVSKIAQQDVDTPWGMLGYVTYKRTYARRLDDQNRTEEYKETVSRILEACQSQLKCGFNNQELQQLYMHLMKLKFSVAGRFLWQLGTSTVDKLGLSSLQNCAFTIIDSPVHPFCWIFDMLMLGVGVGFNIQKHHVALLPRVCEAPVKITRQDTKDADFVVPDSREGWVSLLEKVLESFFIKGKSFSYSTILIRSAGSPIHGFGGVASGPEDLCKGIAQIVDLLSKRHGQALSTVDCLDIVCIIAAIVVSGNVRRSALISLGDCDDIEYLGAKRWDLGGIPNWRAMCNNSVICNNINDLPEDFWAGYHGNGEPYGLVNLALARRIGRVKDGDKYPDPEVQGFNPCLTADTQVLTAQGLRPVLDLVGKQFVAIVDGNAYPSTDKGFWKSGTRGIRRLTLANGIVIEATGNHKFLTVGGWTCVDDMVTGATNIVLCDNTGYRWDDGSEGDYERGYQVGRSATLMTEIPQDGSFEFTRGLLRGVFDASGDVVDGNKIHLGRDQDSAQLRRVQHLLFALGVCSSHDRANGILVIGGASVLKFKEVLGGTLPGLYDDDELDKDSDFDTFTSMVVDITDSEEEVDVYDCTIPDVHCFSANGTVSHNCSEQPLANFETCCLSEVFLPNLTSFEEAVSVVTFAYRICKHSLLLPCHHKDTERIVRKNMRMGIGMTGYMQATEEQRAWLDPLYKYLRELDDDYSAKLGVTSSIKLSTLKPSGEFFRCHL